MTVTTPEDAGPVTVRLLYVFTPVIVRERAVVEVKETLLNAKPPEEIPAVLPDKFICDVPALKVRLVVDDAANDPVELAEIVTVEEPKFSVLARALLILKLNVVNAKLAVLTVPVLNVKVALPIVNALPNVHPPPAPLNRTLPNIVVPLVVTVLPVVVAEKVIVPVALHTVPANSDIEPRMSSVGDVPVAKVTVPAETVMSRHAKAPVIVTV